MQNNIVVVITNGVAIRGALTHEGHLYYLAYLCSIESQLAGLGMVQTHDNFRLFLRVRNINIRSTGHGFQLICQIHCILLQLFNIIATQTNLYRTAITTTAALIGHNGYLQSFRIAKLATQLIHDLLHAALTLIGGLEAYIQRALVNRITAVTNIQSHNLHLGQTTNVLLHGRCQLHSLLQTATNGRLHVHCEFAGVIGRSELRAHKGQQQKVNAQTEHADQNNLFGSIQAPTHEVIIHLANALEACLELIQNNLQIFITTLGALLLGLHLNPISGHHRSQRKSD